MGVKQQVKKFLIKVGKRIAPPLLYRVVVLCYHSVYPTRSFASITPSLFEQHLLWIKENCRLAPFNQILCHTRGNKEDRPTVSITFDDGYADNYEYAFPLLQKFGIKATFFC